MSIHRLENINNDGFGKCLPIQEQKKNEKIQCIHNKYKYGCGICKGLRICSHLVVRNTCTKCKLQRKIYYQYSLKCHHDKYKYNCQICRDFQICRHFVTRNMCDICVRQNVKIKMDLDSIYKKKEKFFGHCLDFFIDYFEKEEKNLF